MLRLEAWRRAEDGFLAHRRMSTVVWCSRCRELSRPDRRAGRGVERVWVGIERGGLGGWNYIWECKWKLYLFSAPLPLLASRVCSRRNRCPPSQAFLRERVKSNISMGQLNIVWARVKYIVQHF